MTDDSFSGFLFAHLLQPAGIFASVLAAFVAWYWVLSTPLNSALTGWVTLGDYYRVRSHPKSGQPGYVQIGKNWGGAYSPSTMYSVSKEGLYIWTYWFYSFLQPAVLVPWKDITDIKELDMPLSNNRSAWNLITKQNVKIYMNDRAFMTAEPYLAHLGGRSPR